MNTNRKRRMLLMGSLGALASTGFLTPQLALAVWPKEAFSAETVDAAIKALLGGNGVTESSAIKIKAPEIAEDGAVVQVEVSTTLKNVESISIIAEKNALPLVASFELAASAEPFVSTRIKMNKTSDVVVLVKAGGKLYSAKREVIVTIGGCGG